MFIPTVGSVNKTSNFIWKVVNLLLLLDHDKHIHLRATVGKRIHCPQVQRIVDYID